MDRQAGRQEDKETLGQQYLKPQWHPKTTLSVQTDKLAFKKTKSLVIQCHI